MILIIFDQEYQEFFFKKYNNLLPTGKGNKLLQEVRELFSSEPVENSFEN